MTITANREQNGTIHQSVMEQVGIGVNEKGDQETVTFKRPDDDGNKANETWVHMPVHKWEDFGRPSQITVMVRAGDLLNQPHEFVPPWMPEGVPPSIWCQTCHEHKALHPEYDDKEWPEQRVFSGKMDGDLELWLGNAFESWLPSTEQLLIRNFRGEEQTVVAGQWLIMGPDGRFRVEDRPDHE